MAITSTPRLTLSLLQFSGWSFFQKLREYPGVMHYIGGTAPAKDTQLLFTKRLTAQHTFVIREHNSLIPLGDVGPQISHSYPQEAGLNYAVMSQAQRNGITNEAVHAVHQYASEHTGVAAVSAYALADSRGSIRILEKTDSVRTQVPEGAYETDDTAYNNWVFRLERDALRLQAQKA